MTDTDGPSGWAGFAGIAALSEAIQESLADGVPVVLPGYELVVLPDLALLEMQANSYTVPGGYLVLRNDGRSARIVQIPDPEGTPA